MLTFTAATEVNRKRGNGGATALKIADFIGAHPGCRAAHVSTGIGVSVVATDYSPFQCGFKVGQGEYPPIACHESRNGNTGALLRLGFLLVPRNGGLEVETLTLEHCTAKLDALKGARGQNVPDMLAGLEAYRNTAMVHDLETSKGKTKK